MATRTRQLTMHFDEKSQYILDYIKNEAKDKYRSDDQHAVFMLSTIVPKPVRKDDSVIYEEKGAM